MADSMRLSDSGVFSATLFSADGNLSTKLLLRAAADDAAAPAWRMQLTQRQTSNDFAISRLVLPATAAAVVRQLDAKLLPANTQVLRAESGDSQWWSEVEIREAPFRLRLFVGRGVTTHRKDLSPSVVFNGGGLLRFAGSDASLTSALRTSCAPGVGRSFADTQPDGCTAVAADVSFPSALEAFGLPERASPLVLQPTVQQTGPPTVDAHVDAAAGTATSTATVTAAITAAAAVTATPTALRFAPLNAADGRPREPYRLFNLDVFKYGPGDPVPLYGALPFVLAHGAHAAAGALWLNAAETHMDLWRGPTAVMTADASSGHGLGTAWLSEGGAVELLLFAGPTARHVLRQLALTTGRPPMPPLWSLGYHQSHWNVKTQEQMASLDRNFDRHGIPLDVGWLDIEHTGAQCHRRHQRAATCPRLCARAPHRMRCRRHA